MRKSDQKAFNFFGRIYGPIGFNFSIWLIAFKYMQGLF